MPNSRITERGTHLSSAVLIFQQLKKRLIVRGIEGFS